MLSIDVKRVTSKKKNSTVFVFLKIHDGVSKMDHYDDTMSIRVRFLGDGKIQNQHKSNEFPP